MRRQFSIQHFINRVIFFESISFQFPSIYRFRTLYAWTPGVFKSNHNYSVEECCSMTEDEVMRRRNAYCNWLFPSDFTISWYFCLRSLTITVKRSSEGSLRSTSDSILVLKSLISFAIQEAFWRRSLSSYVSWADLIRFSAWCCTIKENSPVRKLTQYE